MGEFWIIVAAVGGVIVGWAISEGRFAATLTIASEQRDRARKEAGKLSRIIGRQRRMIREYKKQIPVDQAKVAAKRAQYAPISH